ncbi:MAG: hypothetical protein QXK45_06255 [Thermofilaceae archaeon]
MEVRGKEAFEELIVGGKPEVQEFMKDDHGAHGRRLAEKIPVEREPTRGGTAGPLAFHCADADLFGLDP